jgi:hypothetical protein
VLLSLPARATEPVHFREGAPLGKTTKVTIARGCPDAAAEVVSDFKVGGTSSVKTLSESVGVPAVHHCHLAIVSTQKGVT